MQRHLILVFLLFSLCAHAEWDHLFSDDEDPTLFHHVNVITGNLNLCLQDTVVPGPQPLAIYRTYSSSGALEKTARHDDLLLKYHRKGFMLQGGWSLFPHANLIVEPTYDRHGYKAYVPEKSGNLIPYSYSHREGPYFLFLKPDLKTGQCSGHLTARTNPKNNLLRINLKDGRAYLSLPDGSYRWYQGPHLHAYDKQRRTCFFLLEEEVFPNEFRIQYKYDSKSNLRSMHLLGPGSDHTFSSLTFQYHRTDTPYVFNIKTSDDKEIHYQAKEVKTRDYMHAIRSNCRPIERTTYVPSRSGHGARMRSMQIGDRLQFIADYYLPPNKRTAKKWAYGLKKVAFPIDKVSALHAPIGPNSEMMMLARFEYFNHYTDVRDAENVLTRYYHNGHHLLAIHSFTANDELYAQITFQWVDGALQNKALRNAAGEILFAKSFYYDPYGNVIKEVLWGNLSGDATGELILDPHGNVLGAESYTKTFTYLPHFNVPLTETEQGGVTTHYTYKPGSNLVLSKLIQNEEGILIREWFSYDGNNLLLEEKIDNGTTNDPHDFTGVTQQSIKRYTHHPETGLPLSLTELYWDPHTRREHLLRKTVYTYSIHRTIESEAVYDANGEHCYTLYTDTDAAGRVTRKTTPSGLVNTYAYDAQGNLITCKEVGSSKKEIQRDGMSRPIQTISIDGSHHPKTTATVYDCKNRAVAQTDPKNNTSTYCFDPFGRCLQTQFCSTNGQEGATVAFTYDTQGNLTSSTLPQGEKTCTTYNALAKPIQIVQADGQLISHRYDLNGTLSSSLYPDGSQVMYGYDSFRRMRSKKIYSPNKELLAEEQWEFNAFQLISHTDYYGLTTTYTYDGAGRKIAEETEGRVRTYTYDALSRLERITENDRSHVEIHDLEGQVIDQWEESSDGTIENRIQFVYDEENRKEKAIRHTPNGKTIDLFSYDSEGRLTRHTDPEGHVTEFLYNDFYLNEFGQSVLQKITIDPIHHTTIETYDPLNHLVEQVKTGPTGNPVFKERYDYDDSGNQIRRTSFVFKEDKIVQSISVTWKHDPMGRVIEENEADQKITRYTYDSNGRMTERILPSGTILFYTYDALNRITSQKSSDGTIDYQYLYENGPHPTQIIDHIQQSTLLRTYSPFGELLTETSSSGYQLKWEYDVYGRCTQLTLPDQSAIAYRYTPLHMTHVQRYAPDRTLLYEHHYAQFDENGHVIEEELIHQLGTLRTTHDLLERPLSQSTSWLHHTATYGPSGLVIETDNTLFGRKTYAYDPLNQLTREGELTYTFDSLGNPAHCTVNALNQILSTPDSELLYDPNGNPVEKHTADSLITYSYDALGRLTSITYPKQKKICYLYDPLSRLIAKKTYTYFSDWHYTHTTTYLYDQENEIGIINEQGTLQQLKVLGLGIQGKVGASIALELNRTVYMPLHDFNGNIIALISKDGILAESYQINAFGQETYAAPPLNPWRFSSKRSEDGLIHFGKRFYDPSLGRWLTPDPTGFADGSNLYAYVRNSPLNRLDLFGLFSEEFSPPPLQIMIPIHCFAMNIPQARVNEITVKGMINNTSVDWFISSGYFHQLKFSQEEIQTGQVNIVDHFIDLMPTETQTYGLVTAQNGILTELRDFQDLCRSITSQIPEGTLFIGLHNPTHGVTADVHRVAEELKNLVDTATVIRTRQFFSAIITGISKISPDLLWKHIAHSEGGLIAVRAIEGLPPEQKQLLQKHLDYFGVGPASPMPKTYAFKTHNVYSVKDGITKRYARHAIGNLEYNVEIVPCISTPDQLILKQDHGFLGNTYKQATNEEISQGRKIYGFYNGETR